MRYERRVIDGETVIVRVTAPDPEEQENEPGSYEAFLWMFGGLNHREVADG